MKPKVWHLIGDKRAGGSNHFVNQLISSRLGDRVDFLVLRLEEVKARLKTEKPDVIIFHYPCAWKYLGDLLYLKTKSRLFICDHHYCQGFEADQVRSKFRFRWLLKIAYGLADGVISVSRSQRQWMLEANLINPQKIRVIPPASRVENLLKIPPKLPTKPLILGAYGRFARQKGFDRLLEIMALLPPEKFQLQLGGYGPDESIIQQLAANLPQVHLLGPIENVAEFLAHCDAILISSRWEPFGLVCLEAKAAGKPVLVAQIDGLPEQVNNCGVILPPDDLNAWKNAIAHLEKLPPEDLIILGQIGRESVVNAWETCVENWESFLREVTGEGFM
jgi:glycosyltransferase involved in cell wall biosynthesis